MSIAIVFFLIGATCGVVRLLIGPGLAERVMALDVTLTCLMGAVAVDAARRGDTTYLILLIVIAIVGFTATVAASRFLEGTASEGATTVGATSEGETL